MKKMMRWFQLTALVVSAATRLAGAAQLHDTLAPNTCHCQHIAADVHQLSGAGIPHQATSNTCIWCHGSGKCYGCHGSGTWLGKKCHLCMGSGTCSACMGAGHVF